MTLLQSPEGAIFHFVKIKSTFSNFVLKLHFECIGLLTPLFKCKHSFWTESERLMLAVGTRPTLCNGRREKRFLTGTVCRERTEPRTTLTIAPLDHPGAQEEMKIILFTNIEKCLQLNLLQLVMNVY